MTPMFDPFACIVGLMSLSGKLSTFKIATRVMIEYGGYIYAIINNFHPKKTHLEENGSSSAKILRVSINDNKIYTIQCVPLERLPTMRVNGTNAQLT